MSERIEEALMMGVTALLLLAGLCFLFLKDHLKRRIARGDPMLPRWVRELAFILFIAAFVGGFVAMALSNLVIGAGLVSSCLLYVLWLQHPGPGFRSQAQFLHEIGEALRAGLPLPHFLNAMASDKKGAMAADIRRAAESLSNGQSLETALATESLLAPHVSAAMRACREQGGAALPAVLRDAATDLRYEADYEGRLALRRIYPMATWIACVPFSLLVLMVGARYRALFGALNQYVYYSWWPYYMDAAQTIYIATSILLLVLMAHWYIRGQRRHPLAVGRPWKYVAKAQHVFVDSLPPFSFRRRNRCLMRVTRTLATLLRARIPLQQAARRTAEPDLAGPYASDLIRLAEETECGKPLREALTSCRFPDDFKEMCILGAASGDLPAALETLSEWYAVRAMRIDQRLIAALPLVTIPLLGLLVAMAYIPFIYAITNVSSSIRDSFWP